MSRLRAPAKNEVKTRLEDDEYDALQIFRDQYGYDSDSQALKRAVRMLLLGVVGILPKGVSDVSATVAQRGPGLGR